MQAFAICFVNLPATAHDIHHVPQSSGVEISRPMHFTLPLRPTGSKRKVVEDNTVAPQKSKVAKIDDNTSEVPQESTSPKIMRETSLTT